MIVHSIVCSVHDRSIDGGFCTCGAEAKRCSCCGREHDAHAWYQLAYVGVQVTPADALGPEERLELRNCACGSTLARVET